MRSFNSAAAAFLAFLTVSQGQTTTSCNPTNTTCPADTGLSSVTYSADFTSAGANASWTAAAYSEMTYTSDDGAVFTISKEGQAPTIETDFYFFFGRVDVTMKAAPGQGIVSSIVLESDDLDEIDWEFIGGDDTQVQSNFYGKGNTTTYDRVVYHSVATPQTTWHTYTFDWTSERINYLIDGTVVRTVEYSEALTVYGKNYPQTPMRLKLGNWAGGAPGNSEGTIEWAGGKTNFDNAPFTMYVKSVSITNNNPACEYKYGDKTGDFSSIDVITTGDACSANGTATAASTVAPTSSHSVAPVKQTEAVVSSTVTGSAYSTNSASVSALNENVSSTTSPTGTNPTATSSASTSASTSGTGSYTGDTSPLRSAPSVFLGILAAFWMV